MTRLKASSFGVLNNLELWSWTECFKREVRLLKGMISQSWNKRTQNIPWVESLALTSIEQTWYRRGRYRTTQRWLFIRRFGMTLIRLISIKKYLYLLKTIVKHLYITQWRARRLLKNVKKEQALDWLRILLTLKIHRKTLNLLSLRSHPLIHEAILPSKERTRPYMT